MIKLIQPTQHGFFYDDADKTFVCFIPDDSKRDYYVPDTLVQLKRVDLVNRIKQILKY